MMEMARVLHDASPRQDRLASSGVLTGIEHGMHFTFLLAALLAAGAAAPRQDTAVSSTGVKTASPPSSVSPSGDAPAADLAVSLDRIRDRLSQPAPLQQSLLKRPTFKVEVEERRHIQELLATLDLKSSPAPPGGLYGYETQRVMMNSVNQPLLQPYAVFSGSELLTLALEGLIKKYLGGAAINAITTAERARAETAARSEVSRAIVQYCAGLPDAGAGVRLCAAPDVP
jgi:hypothetical protein